MFEAPFLDLDDTSSMRCTAGSRAVHDTIVPSIKCGHGCRLMSGLYQKFRRAICRLRGHPGRIVTREYSGEVVRIAKRCPLCKTEKIIYRFQ